MISRETVHRIARFWRGLVLLSFVSLCVSASVTSQLFTRGYTVLPEPQQVTLSGRDVGFGTGWRLKLSGQITSNDIAVTSLLEGLESRFHLTVAEPSGTASAGVIHLTISPNSVAIGLAADRDTKTLEEQSYMIDVSANAVHLTASAAPGLFYGVQTLLQLIRLSRGTFYLPEGRIVDWPDVQLRTIYWDDAHHLEHTNELQRIIRQAAFFKINGIIIKLDGHFQYRDAPALVEPYALTAAQLQALTDYGLRYHVQVIPYLDGPAHVAFILKHPEYASLRAFPGNNYEICTTNPESYRLLLGLYGELLAANRGVKYFFVSTDEPYYVGLANNHQCNEVDRSQQLGSRGRVLVDFITKTADYLHNHGREVIFWLDEPLAAADIGSLPKYLINGEEYMPSLTPLLRSHGIRQMIYTVTQGLESLFPNYYILPLSKRLHTPDKLRTERVTENLDQTLFAPQRKSTDLMGSINAGWADLGLHPETFWLGYAVTSAMAWHPRSVNPNELMETFYRIFYGAATQDYGRIYQLMSFEAQFWLDSWDTIPSTVRKPVFGNCSEPRCPIEARAAEDQTLMLPPVPSPTDLAFESTWAQANQRRVELTAELSIVNDELLSLLYRNLGTVEFNHYNLEVFISLAEIYQQNLVMINSLANINNFLQVANSSAAKQQAQDAVAAVDRAIDIAQMIRLQRNCALRDVVATWFRSWLPRVANANGRRLFSELDDVKDHLPDRTSDMKYLIYRELLLPFGEWVAKVQAARNQYARMNHLTTREIDFDWTDTDTLNVLQMQE